VICGQGCVSVQALAWPVFVYSRAAKVDATKKRSVLKKRIKLSGGFILLSGEFFSVCHAERRASSALRNERKSKHPDGGRSSMLRQGVSLETLSPTFLRRPLLACYQVEIPG
jgi:hypothetical protein